MAEVLARRAAEAAGWAGLQVVSAGTGTGGGSPASQGAARAARRHGLELGHHRSSPLTPAAVAEADLVLAMTPSHLARVLELGGGGKSHLLGAYAAGGEGVSGGGAVPDPFGGSDAEYEETFMLLEALVQEALRRIAPMVEP